MSLRLLKKIMSLALAFIIMLSLSCCGEGDEALIDETTTASTSETTEATTTETTAEVTTSETTQEELTTIETTTGETTVTTSDETAEVTTEATTLTVPDETAILATLTDEEKAVWLTMPDIVTMRLLRRYDEDEEELYSEFLYTEIIYIDKLGQIKKFICPGPDRPDPGDKSNTIKWLNEKINENEDAELINVADIHTLIEFYNAVICIDSDSKWVPNYTIGLAVDIERHYWFELYGIRNNREDTLETLCISKGDAGYYYLRRNNTDEEEPIDKSGRKTFDLYLQLDPFMVDIPGGMGHLTGEEG